MSFQPGAVLNTQGFGNRPENLEVPVIAQRAPTTADINYPVGKKWVNEAGDESYTLTSLSTFGSVTTATWTAEGGGTTALATLSGDSGTATPTAGNIQIAGGTNMNTSAAGSTVTVNLDTNLSGLGSISATGDVSIGRADVGAPVLCILENSDNTNAASNAHYQVISGGASGGDPSIQFTVLAAKDWVMGIDNSDSDSFVISNSGTIGTTNVMRVTTGNLVQFPVSDMQVVSTQVGASVLSEVINSDATNGASHAVMEIQSQNGGGDPYILWQIAGLKNWVMGCDQSGGQDLKISNSSAIGTNDVMIIDSATNAIQFSVPSMAVTKSSAAANVLSEVTNSDNTSGTSNAYFQAAVGGTSSGDAAIQFQISGGQNWTVGLDNSASDALVFAASNTLGTSNALSLNATTQEATFANGVTVTAGPVGIQNGNLTLGTAGNKLQLTTGANASIGQDTLVAGTVTVNTTAVTASSLIFLTRASVGSTGAAATGNLVIGTITAGTSFVINAVQAADATALQASDVSVVNWWIIN